MWKFLPKQTHTKKKKHPEKKQQKNAWKTIEISVSRGELADIFNCVSNVELLDNCWIIG